MALDTRIGADHDGPVPIAGANRATSCHRGGGERRTGLREAESFPMFGCETIVCQRATDYVVELDRPITTGDVLTASSAAVALAVAGGTSSSDQSHADWQLDSPLMRVPIP